MDSHCSDARPPRRSKLGLAPRNGVVERHRERSPEDALVKWALVGLGVVGVLMLGIVVIGALLPRDHVATLSSRIAAPPDAVWSALTDPANFPSWRSDLTRVDVLAATIKERSHGL